MDEDEIAVLAVSGLMSLLLAVGSNVSALHPLFFKGNSGTGLVRLAVPVSMLWIGFVLWQYADPSVTGVYVFLYLLMGYATIKLFGQQGAALFGPRLRVDVYERKNLAAATFIAAFTLATGLIFGGSLWGEADPVGDNEGGWWIPAIFFLLGWGCLVGVLWLFLRREAARFLIQIRQNRNVEDARVAAVYVLSTAVILTDAVAGDFFGWRQGLLSFGGIAMMLVVHEVLAPRTPPVPVKEATEKKAPFGRLVEGAFYILSAGLVWLASRWIEGILPVSPGGTIP